MNIFPKPSLSNRISSEFSQAVNTMREGLARNGKIIVIGVGKSENIATKIAATLNSTGAPAVVLNCQNALHGDLGIMAEGDTVLALSYSGEITKVFLTKTCHWKLTNSATMTFAATVKMLRKDEAVLRKWTATTHPQSFWMFMELREAGRSLVNPLPGFATHGENKWLCPLVDWSSVAYDETRK